MVQKLLYVEQFGVKEKMPIHGLLQINMIILLKKKLQKRISMSQILVK